MIEPLHCHKEINGNYYMDIVPGQRCFNYKWYSYLSMIIICIIVYMIVIPFSMFFVIYKNRSKLDLGNIQEKYSSLYSNYKHERYYWSIIIRLRKLIIVLIQLIPSNLWAAGISAIFISISLHVHNIAHPYHLPIHNFVEKLTVVSWLVFLVASVFWVSDKFQDMIKVYQEF